VHGRRDALRRGERLFDQERVAAGRAHESCAVDAAARCESVHRFGPQRRWCQPRRADASRERAGAAGGLVVAEGDDQDARDHVDPPPGDLRRVERQGVRPVDVLDDRQRRPRQRGEQRSGDTREPRLLRERGPQRVAERGGEVVQRAERDGSADPLAPSDGDTAADGPLGERPGQCRLADAGLTGDEDDRPAPAVGGAEQAVERRQLRLPLEDLAHLPRVDPAAV